MLILNYVSISLLYNIVNEMETVGMEILRKMNANNEIVYTLGLLISIDLDSINGHGILLVIFICIVLNSHSETAGQSFLTVTPFLLRQIVCTNGLIQLFVKTNRIPTKP